MATADTILPPGATKDLNVALFLPIDRAMEWHIGGSGIVGQGYIALVESGPGYMGDTNYAAVRSTAYPKERLAAAICVCWLAWKLRISVKEAWKQVEDSNV